jgi:hypothetical protein
MNKSQQKFFTSGNSAQTARENILTNTKNYIKTGALIRIKFSNFTKTQVRKAQFNDDPFLQTFGLQVNQWMTEVHGRVLPPPRLQYGGRVRVIGIKEAILLLPLILFSPESYN